MKDKKVQNGKDVKDVKALIIKRDRSMPLSDIFGRQTILKADQYQTEAREAIKKSASGITNTLVSDNLPAPVYSGDDYFGGMYDKDGLIQPLYDLSFLAQMVEYNSILRQCIDSYKINIVGYGFEPKYTVDIENKLFQSKRSVIDDEWERLRFLYTNCSLDETFEEIMERVIDDKEALGIGLLEVVPNMAGMPAGFNHVVPINFRMTPLDLVPYPVSVDVLGPKGSTVTMTYQKRFRRFCQMISRDGKPIWFKQFGDPRDLNKYTGEYGTKEVPVQNEEKATSIIHFVNYCPYNPYGLPRYMGNLLNMFGSRKAEELNYSYFFNGKHVPMAVVVSNGSLTQSAVEELGRYANDMKGVDNAFGYLVLEAAGFEEDDSFGEASPQGVKIDLKPLTEAIQEDGLFQNYDKSNRVKTRSSYRLSPLYTGESEDFTRSTADTARQLAEEQIFAPERRKISAKFNKLINPLFGVFYVEMVFKGPNLSNKASIAASVNAYVKGGAATPNMLIDALGDLLEKRLEQLPEWGNIPISVLSQLVGQDKIKFKELKGLYKEPDSKPVEPGVQTDPEGLGTAKVKITKTALQLVKEIEKWARDSKEDPGQTV